MGLLVAIEGGRSSEERVRKALRPLAGFGLVHAAHEWIEMFAHVADAGGQPLSPAFMVFSLATLAFSFLSLAAFGGFLLARDETAQRVSLLDPARIGGHLGVWTVQLTRSIRSRLTCTEWWTSGHGTLWQSRPAFWRHSA